MPMASFDPLGGSVADILSVRWTTAPTSLTDALNALGDMLVMDQQTFFRYQLKIK